MMKKVLSHRRYHRLIKRYGDSCQLSLVAQADSKAPWALKEQQKSEGQVTGVVLMKPQHQISHHPSDGGLTRFETKEALVMVDLPKTGSLVHATLTLHQESWRITRPYLLSEQQAEAVYQVTLSKQGNSV